MEAYRGLLEKHFPGLAVSVSRRPGEEYELADRALADGCRLLVAVGGDGTWSHVADRILSSERQDVALGILPAGTGNDFGRNLELSYADPTDAVGRLAQGTPIPVDAGRILTPSRPAESATRDTDAHRVRHFINVVGVGFDVAVVDAAAGARLLRGELLYKVTALQQLFRFRGIPLELELDRGAPVRTDHLMLTVTNGAWFGGGFPIAPDGRVDDGRLHVCSIGNASPLRRMSLFNRAEKGRHTDQPEVTIRPARRVHIRGPGPVRFEADGDVFETDRDVLELEMLPGALQVVRA